MSQPPLPPPPPFAPPPYPPPFPPPAPRRSRALPVVLAVLAALVLVSAAVLVPLLLTRDDDERADAPSGLAAVQTYDDLTNRHVALGEDLDYPQSPPVGGDHAPVWIECGAYDEPLPEVNVVHDLEHGTTWLTYRPDDLGAGDLARLEELLPANGLLSPYPDQEAPVVITVWGRQLALEGADDPRIPLFIDRYGAGETAPEPFASCNGGARPEQVPDPGGPVV